MIPSYANSPLFCTCLSRAITRLAPTALHQGTVVTTGALLFVLAAVIGAIDEPEPEKGRAPRMLVVVMSCCSSRTIDTPDGIVRQVPVAVTVILKPGNTPAIGNIVKLVMKY